MGFGKSKIQVSRTVRKRIPAKAADIYRAFFEQEVALTWLRGAYDAMIWKCLADIRTSIL
jgi:hypothetical protein